jgi:hypothetical protein
LVQVSQSPGRAAIRCQARVIASAHGQFAAIFQRLSQESRICAIIAAVIQAWLISNPWDGKRPIPMFFPVRMASSTLAWTRERRPCRRSSPRQPPRHLRQAGNYGGARTDASRGTDVARQARSRRAEWLNMSMLGLALAHDGEADQAVAVIETALEIASSLPDHLADELEALLNAAQAYITAGKPGRALPVCRRAVELSRGLGDLYCEAEAWGKLGDANLVLGSYQEAVACLSRALPVLRDGGNRRFHAVCLLKLGQAHLALGAPDAAGCLQESLSICGELRLPGLAGRVRKALAQLPAPGPAQ